MSKKTIINVNERPALDWETQMMQYRAHGFCHPMAKENKNDTLCPGKIVHPHLLNTRGKKEISVRDNDNKQ